MTSCPPPGGSPGPLAAAEAGNAGPSWLGNDGLEATAMPASESVASKAADGIAQPPEVWVALAIQANEA